MFKQESSNDQKDGDNDQDQTNCGDDDDEEEYWQRWMKIQSWIIFFSFYAFFILIN